MHSEHLKDQKHAMSHCPHEKKTNTPVKVQEVKNPASIPDTTII